MAEKRNTGSTNHPPVTTAYARKLVDAIRASVLDHLSVAEIGTASKLPFKALSLRELLLHRLGDLGDAAVSLYEMGHWVAGITITRAVIEVVAVLSALNALVSEVAADGAIGEADDVLMRLLFGGRVEGMPQEALNVLTHIDKLDKRFDGVRWFYDELSEVAHPNYFGLMGSYGNLDRERYVLRLGRRKQGRGEGSYIGLQALCASLEVGTGIYNEMARPLRQFCEICERGVVGDD